MNSPRAKRVLYHLRSFGVVIVPLFAIYFAWIIYPKGIMLLSFIGAIALGCAWYSWLFGEHGSIRNWNR